MTLASRRALLSSSHLSSRVARKDYGNVFAIAAAVPTVTSGKLTAKGGEGKKEEGRGGAGGARKRKNHIYLKTALPRLSDPCVSSDSGEADTIPPPASIFSIDIAGRGGTLQGRGEGSGVPGTG